MGKEVKVSKDDATAKEEPLVRMTFEVPISLRKSFKLKAAQEERSIKDLLCELMTNYIKNNGKPE
jgi:hypothetical protein